MLSKNSIDWEFSSCVLAMLGFPGSSVVQETQKYIP